jgi:hypothetical protein
MTKVFTARCGLEKAASMVKKRTGDEVSLLNWTQYKSYIWKGKTSEFGVETTMSRDRVCQKAVTALCGVCDINADYVKSMLNALSKSKTNFDLLLLFRKRQYEKYMETSPRGPVTLDDMIQTKNQYIASLIAIERGHFSGAPRNFVIHSVCSSSSNKVSGGGQMLLAATMYCLHEYARFSRWKNATERNVLMEILNGYDNAAGMISYTRTGFAVDDSMFALDHFKKFKSTLIPMSCDPMVYSKKDWEMCIEEGSLPAEKVKNIVDQDDSGILSVYMSKNEDFDKRNRNALISAAIQIRQSKHRLLRGGLTEKQISNTEKKMESAKQAIAKILARPAGKRVASIAATTRSGRVSRR